VNGLHNNPIDGDRNGVLIDQPEMRRAEDQGDEK
jgi:hypothetical protein